MEQIMIVNFTIFPVGTGESLSSYVAEAFKIIEKCGLPHEHHAMGTNIEGEWDEVMAVVNECRKKMLSMTDRVYLAITIDERKGRTGRLGQKVESAKAKM